MMWEGYGDERLVPHGRNSGSKMINHGEYSSYPMKWTSDRKSAMTSFKECYSNVLEPQDKYTSDYLVNKERFFAGGGFDFLVRLEKTFDNCASIC